MSVFRLSLLLAVLVPAAEGLAHVGLPQIMPQ
jgi:hypothetical protein